MASRLDSAHVEDSTARHWHPVVPALSFVGLVALLNGALNGVLAGMRSTLPPSLQFDYAVTVPLSPLGAGVVLLGAGILAVCSLALFVRSVGSDTSGEMRPFSVTETVLRLVRATAVVVVGMFAMLLGVALLVVPGLVVLVYFPFVFLAVVLDGQTVGGAVRESHARISARPGPVAATSLATALGLVGVGFAGMVSSVLPPAAEFVLGGMASALVVLVGTYILTKLYQLHPSQSSSGYGQL